MRAGSLLVLLLAGAAFAQGDVSAKILHRKVLTADGAALALYRYEPIGGGELKPAVLLIPDVGFDRSVYDFRGHGLARFLQENGRDVFIGELRGQGRSSAPADWSLKDWVERDLPALVSAVQAVHPGSVDLVVEGFGGSLAMAATTSELKGEVNRVIAFSTPVEAELPNDIVRRLLDSGGKFTDLDRHDFEILYLHGGKFPGGLPSEFRSTGLSDLSPVAASELLGFMKTGDFQFSGGDSFKARIRRFDRRTLLFLPLSDNFAHMEFASPIRDVAKAAKIQVQELSRFELMAEDYTHLSMLLGDAAEADVYRRVLSFLLGTDVMPSAAGAQK